MRPLIMLLALTTVPLASYAAAAPAKPASRAAAQAAVDELLAADRAFAKASASLDLTDGLSAMFDAETVMPAPGGFLRGTEAIRAALGANPLNLGARATWTPIRGGISADRQHGFTLGFMTITAEGKPDRKAKYLSYWIRRAAGWRVAVYKRSGRPDGDVSLELMAASLPSKSLRPARNAATITAYRTSLDKAERAFSDDAQRIGIGPAFVKYGSGDATNIGGGPGFTVGNGKIGADVGSQGGPGVRWVPDGGVIVSATGDLGITWGMIKPNGAPQKGRPAESPYTTIWRRAAPDQPWRYIAE